MGRPTRSNPLALAVLACLYERPMHPYEVAQTLRERAKHESVKLNYGSLYSVVAALEGAGMTLPIETIREGKRPERTVYTITEPGKRELVDWLSSLVARPAKEYLNFEAALSFLPVLAPEDAARLLETRIDALKLRLAQLRGALAAAVRADLPRLFELESEYQIELMDAELRFVQRLTAEIKAGTLDGMTMWHSFHALIGDGKPIPPPLSVTFPKKQQPKRQQPER
jgi:DNA-binding PadR family transcriptional regulator